MFKKKKETEEFIEAVEVVEESKPGIAKINNIKEEVVELPVEEVTL